MKKFRLLVETFGKFLSVIGTACLLFIMMYIVCSVLSRAVTGKPLLGTFELGATFLPVIAGFFYVNTDLYDRHIRATIIFDRFSPNLQNLLNASYSVIATIIFAMVGWRVALFGIRNFKMMAETSVLGIPIAPFHFVYSFLLLNFAFYMLIKGVNFVAELTPNREGYLQKPTIRTVQN